MGGPGSASPKRSGPRQPERKLAKTNGNGVDRTGSHVAQTASSVKNDSKSNFTLNGNVVNRNGPPVTRPVKPARNDSNNAETNWKPAKHPERKDKTKNHGSSFI